jgi:hypothetical protein
MKKKSLYLLYHFSEAPSQDSEFASARYRVVYLFNEQGLLKSEQFKKVCDEFGIDKDKPNIDFPTKEELTNFAERLSEQQGSHSIFLLSVNDYNIGIESCHDILAFKEIFSRYGTELDNSSSDKTDRGLFSKFF